ncbi:hypothetical protein CIL05_11395 [Virgibacillus profundi]|uniref:Uncharacterized protein n=1 Tax=Virgibacillus profundi TaxID=2024555 RepID=A0A2A2IEE8_9BACI|nr:hypothetical protein [Virgibacillus profundi]PAV29463.1 hypothetical protein CIL05_11395 [Virgibacillus profundi]PXY53632.1 hypothetical protein CIT14_11505 [Virgibacillus profundi]
MALAAKKLNHSSGGVDKKNFEDSLQRISDQVRWIDQKLTMKIDNEVWQNFQDHQNEIRYTKSIIKNVPFIAKSDKVK